MELTDIKEFNLAAIDVGSNASRLLIKTICVDLEGGMSMRKALFLRVSLRLGMEVFKKGFIRPIGKVPWLGRPIQSAKYRNYTIEKE